MDVLQVNKRYHPHVGGVERVVKQLADGLTARGHDPRVLVATGRGLGGLETVDGVPVRRASSLGTVLSTPLAPTFPVHLARAADRADVLHYHLPNPLAVVSHLLVRPSTPSVVTYHSDIVRQSRALRIYRPLLERMLEDVDRIVTTSPLLRENSEFLAPHQEKTSVVPLGVPTDVIRTADAADDLEAETAPVQDTASSSGSDSVTIQEVNGGTVPRETLVADAVSGVDADLPDRPVVLCVGRLNYYKGVEYLVRAASELETEATVLLVGDGPERENLEVLAESLGVTDRVRFLGTVDDETLAAWYDRADLFVLPSVEPSEAFGIVQLEAMARGVPVVNTELPTGVPWVSVDGETGRTVPPRDAPALADAIDELLGDDELRRRFGNQARERVRTQFTEEQLLTGTIEIYRELTA